VGGLRVEFKGFSQKISIAAGRSDRGVAGIESEIPATLGLGGGRRGPQSALPVPKTVEREEILCGAGGDRTYYDQK